MNNPLPYDPTGQPSDPAGEPGTKCLSLCSAPSTCLIQDHFWYIVKWPRPKVKAQTSQWGNLLFLPLLLVSEFNITCQRFVVWHGAGVSCPSMGLLECLLLLIANDLASTSNLRSSVIHQHTQVGKKRFGCRCLFHKHYITFYFLLIALKPVPWITTKQSK